MRKQWEIIKKVQMYIRTFVLFLLFDLYTFIIIFAIMSEKAETDICKETVVLA